MEKNDSESNEIEFFAKTLTLESSIDYGFKKSSNVIDDGYLTVFGQKDIPVQLVQATDPELKKIIDKELKQAGTSIHPLLCPILYTQKAIELKVGKNYAHAKELLLLIDSAECAYLNEDYTQDNLNCLKSISGVNNFKAVYLFYAFYVPKIITIKAL